VAGEVALEAAHRLDAALALGFLAGEVGARGRVDAPAGDRDDVQGAAELAIAASVEAVAVLAALGDGDRRYAGSARELRVAGEPRGSGGLADQDRCGERAAAGLGEQLRVVLADQVA